MRGGSRRDTFQMSNPTTQTTPTGMLIHFVSSSSSSSSSLFVFMKPVSSLPLKIRLVTLYFTLPGQSVPGLSYKSSSLEFWKFNHLHPSTPNIQIQTLPPAQTSLNQTTSSVRHLLLHHQFLLLLLIKTSGVSLSLSLSLAVLCKIQ